jgi:hypothetical protein
LAPSQQQHKQTQCIPRFALRCPCPHNFYGNTAIKLPIITYSLHPEQERLTVPQSVDLEFEGYVGGLDNKESSNGGEVVDVSAD